jgi:cyclic beta-1,2-glucan synthetase
MRRWRGHFYNWYDLRDLSVLEPAYVSTVGQRQPRRSPDRAAAGVSGAGGRAAARWRLGRALDTALAIAEERAEAAARAGGRGALRAARAALATSEQEPLVAAALASIDELLQRADSTLAAARLSAESATRRASGSRGASARRRRARVDGARSTHDPPPRSASSPRPARPRPPAS